jgi:hypothetical protein
MLLPRQGGVIDNVFIKGVRHIQSEEQGTVTEVTVSNAFGIGEDTGANVNQLFGAAAGG